MLRGARADEPAEFRAARQELASAAALIDALPPERRAQARFFVGVRTAELFEFAGIGDRALELALSARAAAIAAADDGAPVYGGYYRVLLLLILWHRMPEQEFFELVEREEAGFLFDKETAAEVARSARPFHVPLQLLRVEVLMWRGDEPAAFDLLRHTVEDLPRWPSTPARWRDRCRVRLAMLLIGRQEDDRAALHLDQVSSDIGDHPRALLALRRNDLTTAERLARALAERDPTYHHLLGEVLERQGKYEEALTHYLEAMDAHSSAIERAITANSIGDCHLALGRPDVADRWFETFETTLAGLGEVGVTHLRGELCDNLTARGRVRELRSESDAAVEYYRRALDEAERARADIPVPGLGISWLRHDFVTFAVDGLVRTRPDSFEALAAIERGKARGLLDWVSAPPVDTDGLEPLRAAVRALALTVDAGEVARRGRELDRVRELCRRAGLSSAATLDAAGLRAALSARPDDAVLSYWVGWKRAWVLVARAGRVTTHDLGTREAALSHLRAAYEAVADRAPDPWPALDAAAGFFVPAEVRSVLDAANRVVFCPDGRLSRLPFEALRIDGEPLGLRFAVEWAPSLSVRQHLEARRARGEQVVVVDSVVLSDDVERRLGVDPLHFSAQEGDAVAAAYAGSVPVVRLRGRDATLEQLAAALSAAPVGLLHVNAHAVASPLVPSRSLLLLASGPESAESFVGLKLGGAVVVLSACSSAVGEERGGEGVVGLLWGPLGAGARAVIASLWPVNQESTAALMARLHAWRARGCGEAEALRRARNELAARSRFAHPYYWSGFVAHGSRDQNAVLITETPLAWRLAGIVAVMALLVAVFGRYRQGSRSTSVSERGGESRTSQRIPVADR